MIIYIYIYKYIYIYIYIFIFSAEILIPGVQGALCVISSTTSIESKLTLDTVTFDANYGQPIFIIPYEGEMAASLYVQDIQKLVNDVYSVYYYR